MLREVPPKPVADVCELAGGEKGRRTDIIRVLSFQRCCHELERAHALGWRRQGMRRSADAESLKATVDQTIALGYQRQ